MSETTVETPATDAARERENSTVAGRTNGPIAPVAATPPTGGTQNTAGNGKPQARKPAPKASGAKKAATPKNTPAPVVTQPDEGLRANEIKRVVGDALIDAAAAMVRGWDPKKHNGVTVLQASELAGSYCSFTPGSHWQPELDEPDTGRGHKHRLDTAGRKLRAAFIKRHTPAKPARGRKAA